MNRIIGFILAGTVAGSLFLSCTEKEAEIAVSSVSISQPTAEMLIGETVKLSAIISPSNATSKEVVWASSKQSVATVSQDGLVTAITEGTSNITAIAGGKVGSCVVTVSKGVITVTSIELNKSSLELVEGDSATLSATVKPDDATDKTVTWTTSDASIVTVDGGKVKAQKEGQAIITAKAGDKTATCSVKVEIKMNSVDLGLSVKWATCNLGAEKPEEYGDYYAWGETAPKENYFWSNYKWGTSSTSLTKYNADSSRGTVDNKTVLEPEDDVAHVKLGGKWRMPTYAEWEELRKKCTWTWTTNYNGTGAKGRIVTATNGNSIFLPAAGYRVNDKLYYVGSEGRYWSSSLGYSYNAWYAYFYVGYVHMDIGSRSNGFSVRPVSE